MSVINFGNAIFVIGLVMMSYSFSRGVAAIGLFFALVTIAGLLMNPPVKCKEVDI